MRKYLERERKSKGVQRERRKKVEKAKMGIGRYN